MIDIDRIEAPEQDVLMLRLLLKEDSFGFCPADVIDLGGLSGLVKFFELTEADDRLPEFNGLLDQLKAKWNEAIERDKEKAKADALARRRDADRRMVATRAQKKLESKR